MRSQAGGRELEITAIVVWSNGHAGALGSETGGCGRPKCLKTGRSKRRPAGAVEIRPSRASAGAEGGSVPSPPNQVRRPPLVSCSVAIESEPKGVETTARPNAYSG